MHRATTQRLVESCVFPSLLTLTLIDTWANERVIDDGLRHSFQLPSDIKPGVYVVRTELLALHGNTPSMQMTPVHGPEFYLHCFNVEVLGNGTAAPEGVTFPGAYKASDPGLFFSPYYGEGSGVEHNSKYVSIGDSAATNLLTH
jgi:Auxiliary Activity family 9 (formerly GH61)